MMGRTLLVGTMLAALIGCGNEEAADDSEKSDVGAETDSSGGGSNEAGGEEGGAGDEGGSDDEGAETRTASLEVQYFLIGAG